MSQGPLKKRKNWSLPTSDIDELGAALFESQFKDESVVKQTFDLMIRPIKKNVLAASIASAKSFLTYQIYLVEHPHEYQEAYNVALEELCHSINTLLSL